jgi:hypothetical protein
MSISELNLKERDMIRRTVIALWSIGFAFAAANANSPEPSPEMLASVAADCTATGAFGYRFGEHYADKRQLILPPFAIETVTSDRQDGLFKIAAAASFAHAPMSGEDRLALTGWVLNRLDAAITNGHRFSRRQPMRDGVHFFAANIRFAITRDGTTLRLTCTDTSRQSRARDVLHLTP